GGADHGTGLRIDVGESGTIREEPRCGTVSRISAEAGRLRGEPAAIRNQQSRGHDGAPAAGGERAVYRGGVRTGQGLTTVWDGAMRAGGGGCAEASGDSSGGQAR